MGTDIINEQQKRAEDLLKRVNPAYPIEIRVDDWASVSPGLSKRELFAAMAMQGMAARGAVNADLCVSNADALIAALKEDPQA